MLELMQQRRSIRKFTNQPVDADTLTRILKAALVSPTSMGRKSVEVVAVTDPSTLQALAACKKHSSGPLLSATLALAVVADTTKIDVWVEDAAIAAFAMQLVIESQGLGSVWIQMRNRRSAKDEDSEVAVRRVLALPDQYGVLCVLAAGHKGEVKPAYTEADMDFARVHRQRFGVGE